MFTVPVGHLTRTTGFVTVVALFVEAQAKLSLIQT